MNRLPEIVIPQHVPLTPARSQKLSNGIDLYTLDNSDQQVVRVSFVFRAGSSMQSVPFSATAAANLLAEGTARFTAAEIAEKLDFHGSFFDVSADRDYTVITFCSLKRFFAPTLDVAAEILLHPVFPRENLDTYGGRMKQRLVVERSKVAFRARELFAQSLFGAEHPYGFSSPAEAYDTLSRGDVEAFYKQYYVAENCFVVTSGDIDDQTIAQVAALAGRIPSGKRAVVDAFPAPRSERFAFLEHPGAVQSAIRIGWPLFPRTHPDFIPMQIVASILGGYFGSRLVRNLREEHGYTYGVFAGMANMEHAGYMAIATEVAADATDGALNQIFHEIERLRTEPVPEEELQMVKNILAGEVMRVLDGPFGIADVTIENIQNGTDNGYVNRLIEQVRGFTPQRALDAARKYLDPENAVTCVVGDRRPAGR